MTKNFKPETQKEVLDLVKWAADGGHALDIFGNLSKKYYGRATETANGLSLAAFSGISLYEPEELVLSAGAGTPISEIQAVLNKKNQHLAFEPMDLGPILGAAADSGTIGGAISCNLSGPRRIQAGAARDHLLGFNAVSGRGEVFKSGGRVVKNVTGFDLSKLMAGSMGTLAVLTDVILKVLPAPERTRTVLLTTDDLPVAVKAMTVALQSPHDVSAAAYVPANLIRHSDVGYVSAASNGTAAIRIEGPGPSADIRCKKLRKLLSDYGNVEELHSTNSTKFWREVRDIKFLVATGLSEKQVWRISVPPASGAEVAALITNSLDADFYFDWGGGLIWLSIPVQDDAAYEVIRSALKDGGHATLIKASAEVRSNIPVFHPQPSPLVEITKRTKSAFDPRGIFNAGRMYEEV